MTRAQILQAKRIAISRWLIKEGSRRPSEAAMEASEMKPRKVRELYDRLVRLGKIPQIGGVA